MAFHDYPVLLGTAVLAYSFGLRHAVDADHIAAIDNVTRKLMQEGKRPLRPGCSSRSGIRRWWCWRPSAVAATAAAFKDELEDFHDIGGVIGTSVSAAFLLVIAAINVVILLDVYRTFQRVKHGGAFVDDDLDLLLAQRGLLARIFRPLFRLIRQELAHVSARLPVRARLRHRDRGRPARHLGGGGGERAVDLVDPGFPGAVHRRHDADRHHRQRADDRRLWLGLREADAQALLQHDHHVRFGGGRS